MMEHFGVEESAVQHEGCVPPSGDDLQSQGLRSYVDALPSKFNWFEKRMPGVLVSKLTGGVDSQPINCYVIKKGSPLILMDYCDAYLKTLSRLHVGEVSLANKNSESGTSGTSDDCVASVAQKNGQAAVSILPSKFAQSAGLLLTLLKIAFARFLIAPFVLFVKFFCAVPPFDKNIREAATCAAVFGIVSSRIFVAMVLSLLLYPIWPYAPYRDMEPSNWEYIKYLLERLVETLIL